MKATLATLALVLTAATAQADLATAKVLAVSLSPLATTAVFTMDLTAMTLGCERTPCNAKLVQAKEDAATFLASEGTIRSARLEAALQEIRAVYPSLEASDFQLAQEILAL